MTFSDYIDGNGLRVFVCTGIGDSVYASYREKRRGGDSISRVKSNRLPPRDNPYDAQRDLDAYAKEKGWPVRPCPCPLRRTDTGYQGTEAAV